MNTPPENERLTDARIARRLSALIHEDDLAVRALPWYLRRHLAEHASGGKCLDARLLTPDLLPYLDNPRLRAAIESANTSGLIQLLEVMRSVAHVWDDDQPATNAAALALWGRRTSALAPWAVGWSQWRDMSHQILAGHTGPVYAVATATLPNGHPIAVTGSDDHTVRVWDLTTGTQLGDPLTGHTDTVTAVATATLPNGHPIAVTGSYDQTVRVWEIHPSPSKIATQPLPRVAQALSLSWDHGKLVLVAALEENLIRLDATQAVLQGVNDVPRT